MTEIITPDDIQRIRADTEDHRVGPLPRIDYLLLCSSHEALRAENERLRDALLIVANQLPPPVDVPYGTWVYAQIQVYGQDLQEIADALNAAAPGGEGGV